MRNFWIKGSNNRPILCDLRIAKKKDLSKIIVFSHGFKGFKDWGAFNEIADFFCEKGYTFLKFNFSHNGTTLDHPMDFVNLESFGQNNFSKELFDLDQVLNWITKNLNNKVDIHNIILAGHSRGGGISILKSHDTRVSKIISWASVSDFEKRLPTEKIDLWKKRGVVYVYNGRTNQQMPINYQFREDFYKNKNKLSIPVAAKENIKPTLIVHGDQDTTVLLNEGLQLHEWIANSELQIIKSADHVFNTSHPFNKKDGFSSQLKEVLAKTLLFVKK